VASGLIVALGLPQASTGDFHVGGKWFPLLIQILGLGYGSRAHLSADVDMGGWGTFGLHGGVSAIPLIVVVFGLVAVRLFGRRINGGITAPSWIPRAVLAVAGGLVFATVLTVTAAIARLKVGDESIQIGGTVSVHTASFLGFLYQFLIAAAVVYVAFLPRPGGYWQRTVRDLVVTVAEHLGSLVLVLGVVVTIVLAVTSGEYQMLWFAPLLVPFVGLVATGMVHLSSFTTSGSMPRYADYLPSGSHAESFTVFSEHLPGWVWPVAIVIALVWLVAAALRWRVRRGLPGGSDDAMATLVLVPLTYLVAGLVLLLASWFGFSVRMSGRGGGLSGRQQEFSSGFHLAWWVFFVMALVGALVAVASTWLVPAMARTMPRGLLKLLVLGVHPLPTTRTGYVSAPGTPGASLVQPEQPVTARARRWWRVGLIAAVVVVLVGVGGGIAYSVLAKTTYGPDSQARAYLDAIVDGKAEQAAKLSAPRKSKSGAALLTDEVYAKAKKRPTSYEITDTEIGDEEATVIYSLTMDSKTYKSQRIVLKRHGKQAAIFSDWKIVSVPTQQLSIASGPEKLKVNGVEVSLPGLQMPEVGESDDSDDDYGWDDDSESEDSDAAVSYQVLPGEYTFTAPESTKYVSYGDDVSVSVTPGSKEFTRGFAPHYTQAVIDDAKAQVKKKLAACVGSTAEYPKGCALSGWVWDEKKDEPFKMKSRTWQSGPEISMVAGEYDDTVDDPAQLTGNFSVRVEAQVKVDYKYKFDKKDKDWYDRETTYLLNDDDDGWGSRLDLPVTVDGDVKVDMSALNKKTDNNGW
jgi:hypothetical protein